MKRIVTVALAAATFFTLSPTLRAAEQTEEGFTALFDGKTMNGWKTAEENKDTWKVVDGALVAHGEPFQHSGIRSLEFT